MNLSKKNISLSAKIAVSTLAVSLAIASYPNAASAVEAPLSMGTASTYGVLASAAVTSATSSGITGTAGSDIGVGNGTAPTGTFSPVGAVVLAGSSLAALTAATNALSDNRNGGVTGVELGGTTKSPGAYTNPTLGITGTLTLDGGGDSGAVFIFRTDSTLITAASSSVVLINGAQACNVFWQVGSSATLGDSSTMVGHVIAYASVSAGVGTTVKGQLIGTTGSVSLGGTSIENNSCVTPTPTPVASTTTIPVEPPRIIWSTYFSGCLDETGDAPDGIGVTAATNASFALPGNIGSLTNPAKATPLARAGYTFLGWAATSTATTVLTGAFTPTGNSTLCAIWESLPVVIITPTPVATPIATVEPTPIATVEPTPVATPVATVEPTPIPVIATEDGGLLPTTSTPWGNLLLLGGVLIALSAALLGTRKALNR